MSKTLHFKNRNDYIKWLRWNFENNRKEMLDGRNSRIYIAGHKYKPDHSVREERRKHKREKKYKEKKHKSKYHHHRSRKR